MVEHPFKRRPKKRVVYGNACKTHNQTSRPHLPPTTPKPQRISMTGLEGKRIKEIKRNDREVDPEKRVDRLLAIAIEHGPERLANEIKVHERKLNDLREALRRYAATTVT